jgi:hypothetical protein
MLFFAISGFSRYNGLIVFGNISISFDTGMNHPKKQAYIFFLAFSVTFGTALLYCTLTVTSFTFVEKAQKAGTHVEIPKMIHTISFFVQWEVSLPTSSF